MHRPLTDTAVHGSVTLQGIGGPRAFRRRLLDLGFVVGTPVRIVGVAPLGDPYEIEIRGGRISIRRAEAECLRVGPVLTTPAPLSDALVPSPA